MPIKTHLMVPEVVTGYVLNPARSFFSVIVPEATVNYVTDPHNALNGGYYASGAATILRQTVTKRRSVYAYKVTVSTAPGGIGYALTDALAGSNDYTFSLDLLGLGTFTLFFGNSSGVLVGQTKIVSGNGFWQRYAFSQYITATNVETVTIQANQPGVFYVDGFQVENIDHATTFCSGALGSSRGQANFDYAWLGAPNRSMSIRSVQAFDGGRVIPLSDLGFDVMSMLSLGFAESTNQFEDYALLSGAFYLGSRSGRRTFTLVGSVSANDFIALLCKRFKIGTSLTGGGETVKPITLVAQLFDGETPISAEATITAIYKSGLEGNLDNLYQERVSIIFETDNVLFQDSGLSSQILTVDTEFPDASGVIGINGDGVVTELGIYCGEDKPRNMLIGPDNNLYYTCGADLIQFNGYTHVTVYTAPDYIWALGNGPDGRIYFSYGVPASGASHLNAIDLTTGAIDTLGGMSTSFPGGIYAITAGRNGDLYIGGVFIAISNATTGAIPVLNIARYDIRTGRFVALGTGLGLYPAYTFYGVQAIIVDNSGLVWAGGSFSNGLDIDHYIHGLAIWDGVQWEPTGNFSVGTPVTIASAGQAVIFDMVYDKTRDIIYVAGRFDAFRCQQSPSTTIEGVRNIAAIRASDRGIVTGNPDPANAPLFGINSVTRMEGGLGYFGSAAVPSYEGEALALALACDGTLAVVGNFAYAQNMADDNVAGTPLAYVNVDYVPAPGVAFWNPDSKRWVPTPFVAPSLSPFSESYAVPVVAYGGKCDKGSGNASDYTVGVNLPSSGLASYVQPGSSDSFFFDLQGLVGLTTAYVNTVDNACAVSARPLLEISGPGNLQFIKNLTNGKSIVINNRYVLTGETLTIDTNIGSSGLFSSTQGDQTVLISRASSFPDFTLARGENKIIVRMTNTNANTHVVLRWKKQYASLDALCENGCEL